MATITIDEARAGIQKLKSLDSIAFTDKDGGVRIGTVRIRKIFCGKKTCTKCPHASYAYARYHANNKPMEKYIGAIR